MNTRREELLARCRHERYELVAATAATVASTRRLAHWVRATSRLLRVLARSWHRHAP
jgi:hypothetical protein